MFTKIIGKIQQTHSQTIRKQFSNYFYRFLGQPADEHEVLQRHRVQLLHLRRRSRKRQDTGNLHQRQEPNQDYLKKLKFLAFYFILSFNEMYFHIIMAMEC